MTNDRWAEAIRKRGRRATRPRRAILEILSLAKDHPSAKELFRMLSQRCPSSGLTTIYRALEFLIESGMVERYDFGDGRSRYELSQELGRKRPHHHLLCKACQRVFDYSGRVGPETVALRSRDKQTNQRRKFTIDGHGIVFRGLCEQCRRAQGGRDNAQR